MKKNYNLNKQELFWKAVVQVILKCYKQSSKNKTKSLKGNCEQAHFSNSSVLAYNFAKNELKGYLSFFDNKCRTFLS